MCELNLVTSTLEFGKDRKEIQTFENVRTCKRSSISLFDKLLSVNLERERGVSDAR